MPTPLSNWSIELTTEQEFEEDLELTLRDSRVIKKSVGKTFFRFKLYYNEELVFSLDSNPEADPVILIKAMGNEGNRMPWEYLLDDANRIE